MKEYFVYIMANESRSIYISVTNKIFRRGYEHKNDIASGFIKKYKLKKLVFFESYLDILTAIGREKYLKGWIRSKKVRLIESFNPEWCDLSEEWY